jgi:hypothetical protein
MSRARRRIGRIRERRAGADWLTGRARGWLTGRRAPTRPVGRSFGIVGLDTRAPVSEGVWLTGTAWDRHGEARGQPLRGVTGNNRWLNGRPCCACDGARHPQGSLARPANCRRSPAVPAHERRARVDGRLPRVSEVYIIACLQAGGRARGRRQALPQARSRAVSPAGEGCDGKGTSDGGSQVDAVTHPRTTSARRRGGPDAQFSS